MNIEKAAQINHEIIIEMQKMIGDPVVPSWDDAPEWMKQSTRDGLSNHATSAEHNHALWMTDRVNDGWVYGETKDEEAKTHPCLIPYAEVPIEQRLKDVSMLVLKRFISQG